MASSGRDAPRTAHGRLPAPRAARAVRFAGSGLALAAALVAVGSPARAQRGATGVGSSATPSLGRVLVASELEPGLDAALAAGWGFTEDVLGAGDSHHRVAGSAAVAGRPLRWLTIGGRLDGRWDEHLGPGNADRSGVGEPRLFLRGDLEVAPRLSIGIAAIWLVPGAEAPSLAFEASTLDLRGLVSWSPDGAPLVLALDVGWRFDGTANAVPRPVPFRRADLVSLGASDSDALLLGAGVAFALDEEGTELFAELSADLLVERAIEASPVRIGAGARLPLAPRLLSFFAAAEVGLGGRAAVDPSGPLAPVEPRVALTVGLVLSPRSAAGGAALGDDGRDEREPEIGSTAGEGGGAPPALRAVTGRVLDPSGSAVAGARVHVAGAPEPSAATAADGSFVLEGVAADAELVVEADGYVSASFRAGEGAFEAVLARALPSGALRGLVRSHSGAPLVARVVVEPGGLTATTDADGVFELELAPGHYEVVLEAAGHEPQRRSVEIEEDGVTVINADLRRSR